MKMAMCDGVNVQLMERSTAEPNPNFIFGTRINTTRSTQSVSPLEVLWQQLLTILLACFSF